MQAIKYIYIYIYMSGFSKKSLWTYQHENILQLHSHEAIIQQLFFPLPSTIQVLPARPASVKPHQVVVSSMRRILFACLAHLSSFSCWSLSCTKASNAAMWMHKKRQVYYSNTVGLEAKTLPKSIQHCGNSQVHARFKSTCLSNHEYTGKNQASWVPLTTHRYMQGSKVHACQIISTQAQIKLHEYHSQLTGTCKSLKYMQTKSQIHWYKSSSQVQTSKYKSHISNKKSWKIFEKTFQKNM